MPTPSTDPQAPSSSASPFPPQSPLPFPHPLNPFRPPGEPIVVPHRVDERCFTYCQQRATTRMLGAEPICRTLCWRRVMYYEDKAAKVRRGEINMDEAFFSVTINGPPPRNLPPPLGGSGRWVGPGLPVGFRRGEPETEEHEVSRPSLPAVGPDIFPSTPTNAWTLPFLKGRYLYYARGPSRAAERMQSMRDIGLGEGWEEDMKEARAEEVRAMGLKEIEAVAKGGHRKATAEEEEWDPDFAILISLELIPPTVQSAVQSYFSRVYGPVTRMVSRYRESFSSGYQERTARALWEKAWDTEDGAVGTLRKMSASMERKRKEMEKEEREKREKEGGNP